MCRGEQTGSDAEVSMDHVHGRFNTSPLPVGDGRLLRKSQTLVNHNVEHESTDRPAAFG